MALPAAPPLRGPAAFSVGIAVAVILALAVFLPSPAGAQTSFSGSLLGGFTNVTTRDSSELQGGVRANALAHVDPAIAIGPELGYYRLGAPFGEVLEHAHARVIQSTVEARARGITGIIRPAVTVGAGLYAVRPPDHEGGTLGDAHFGWNLGVGADLGYGPWRFTIDGRWHWISTDSPENRFGTILMGVTLH